MCEATSVHPFEERGLGVAPFRCVGMFEDRGPHFLDDGTQIGSPGQPMGTCDYCGQGIAYCFRIVSLDGKRFVVGCDCVRKCDRDDNRLTTEVVRLMSNHKKQVQAAKQEAERAQRAAKLEESLQRQRATNGGLTDAEVADKARQKELKRLADLMSDKNAFILDVLCRERFTPFIESMIEKLQRAPARELSPRCLEILSDIYSKRKGGRAGSKAYSAAAEEFATLVNG